MTKLSFLKLWLLYEFVEHENKLVLVGVRPWLKWIIILYVWIPAIVKWIPVIIRIVINAVRAFITYRIEAMAMWITFTKMYKKPGGK
jgi:hypothetical protein